MDIFGQEVMLTVILLLHNSKSVKLYIRKCWIWQRNRQRKHARQKQHDWQINDLRAIVSCLGSLNKVEIGAGASDILSSSSNMMGSVDTTSSLGGGGDEAIIGRF
eukprot:14360311-Ditylum_brightwellii.AAC.2